MSYLALYRKYRPTSFDDVYGQEAIVKTMKAALKNNKVSHAYLFCGPRGTGKTTIAKLIGRTVNCKEYPIDSPCGKCDICVRNDNGENVDIIEIDAASNNGVDEIREIRNKVSLVPTSSKYKVYIIDEVHMLTTGAFNALLKTLEEPPPHVIFILATTEPYKIPNTIISRCQRFDFKKVNNDEIVNCLKSIIDKEEEKVADEVLYEIATLSDGGMRDAISLLDQLISYTDKEPSVDDIHLINGTLTKNELGDFVLNVYKNNSYEVINMISRYNSSGKDFIKIVDELILFVRNVLLCKMNCQENKCISKELLDVDSEFLYKIIDSMLDVKNNLKSSSYEKLLFELTLLKLMSHYDGNISREIKLETKTKKENEIKEINKEKEEVIKSVVESEVAPIEIPSVEIEETSVVEKKIEEPKKTICDEAELEEKFEEFKMVRINNVFATADKIALAKIKNNWSKINEYSVHELYGVYAGMLLDGEVRAVGDSILLISYPYSSISDRVNKCLDKIEKFCKEVFDIKYKVICVDDVEWEKLKKDYIKNIKNNKKYELMDEKLKLKDVIIKKEIGKKKKKEISKEAMDAVSIFGDDVVEII